MEIKIRIGEAKDVKALLQLIQELAEYEKAPKEVIVTEEILLKDGFGDQPLFEFYVAEVENVVRGIALIYTKYSTWKGPCLFLEDIVVQQSHRKFGIGSKLLERVIAEAEFRKVKRLEWQVLDWNTPAIEFYKKHQTIFEPEWINCKRVF